MIALDSNVLIYSFDKNGIYYEKSVNFLNNLRNSEKKIAVSHLTLIEFFQIITDKNKMENPLDIEAASDIISSIFDNDDFEILPINDKIIQEAFFTVKDYKIVKYGIYDHLLAFICKENNISYFATYNNKDFEKYSFLNIINPKE